MHTIHDFNVRLEFICRLRKNRTYHPAEKFPPPTKPLRGIGGWEISAGADLPGDLRIGKWWCLLLLT